jgi:hypothetical protein
MNSNHDPETMTADERRAEVAGRVPRGHVACGLLRAVRDAPSRASSTSEKVTESGESSEGPSGTSRDSSGDLPLEGAERPAPGFASRNFPLAVVCLFVLVIAGGPFAHFNSEKWFQSRFGAYASHHAFFTPAPCRPCHSHRRWRTARAGARPCSPHDSESLQSSLG